MINEILNLPLRVGFSHNNKVNPHYLVDDKGVNIAAVNTEVIKRVSLSKIALALNMFDLVFDDLEDSLNLLAATYTESKANTISDPNERADYLKAVKDIKVRIEYVERLRKDAS
jgi:SpoU rRNA methylase family enzyme